MEPVYVPADSEFFPARLRGIYDPPDGLWTRTDPSSLEQLSSSQTVAIVGARACSSMGASFARRLAADLAERGVCIVSGLARGIDTAAHEGALSCDGLTAAVLGCGVDRVYPAANAALAEQIVVRGLLVSEYAPDEPPAPWRFPARNRIVAGLADVVVVVEATEQSGSLNAATRALDEERVLLVVPGPPWQPSYAGSNALLRRPDVRPCLGVDDVLEALAFTTRRGTPHGA